MEISDMVLLYVGCIEIALPLTLVFYICDFMVTTFLRAALGGRLTFKSF